MIKFSRREDYAVVLVNSLAQAYNKKLVPLSDIAKEYNISLLFLRNLANELRNAGVIKAVEGKSGGYYLTKPPETLKMGEVLSVFSKNELLACCPTTEMGTQKRTCPKQGFCIAGNTWRQLNKEFLDKIYGLSLQEFMNYKANTAA
jgi:Rrf2 family transcriptional regulator, iron-sulfur cluster assembly transcription factor